MNLADVFTVTFVILGFLIVFNCYWLIAEALFPQLVGRATARYGERPIQTTLLGALIGVPIFVLGMATAGKGGPLKLIGFISLTAPALAGLFGSAGLARRIGAGLMSPLDESQPWRRVLRGGIVLSIAFVLPFIGWFVVMPAVLASGVGALAGPWLDARRARRQAEKAAKAAPQLAEPAQAAAPEERDEEGAAA